MLMGFYTALRKGSKVGNAAVQFGAIVGQQQMVMELERVLNAANTGNLRTCYIASINFLMLPETAAMGELGATERVILAKALMEAAHKLLE